MIINDAIVVNDVLQSCLRASLISGSYGEGGKMIWTEKKWMEDQFLRQKTRHAIAGHY